METVKHYSGVAMQVLRHGHYHRCWRVALKGMFQKTAAWLSDKQYLLGCKGIGEARQGGVAIPYPKCFSIFSICSKNVDGIRCSSSVLRSLNEKRYFPLAMMVCSLLDITCFMRTTSDS